MRRDAAYFAIPPFGLTNKPRWRIQFRQQGRPLAQGRIAQGKTNSMRTLLEDMQLRRNAGFVQRGVKVHAILYWHDVIIAGGEKECGRSLSRNMKFVGEFLD